jgi:hypothetical protein
MKILLCILSLFLLRLRAGVLVFLALVSASASQAADAPTGEKIYRERCAVCHGAHGEGTPKGYPKPLAGSRSVAQLTRLISKTMPEDDPGTCVGKEAEKVAAYIYDAFYSRAAQARNAPPRLELARLTVNQYRNVMIDLIGSFREPAKYDDERGLEAEYFNSPRPGRGKPVLSRRDAEVRFKFGEASPDPKIQPKEFAIRWRGSVLAPETGEYEFILRTDNGARLWVNDPTKPLIDAWVRSGSDSQYRASIRLLGGRAYPLRLECFKSARDKSAGITLAWKVPQLAEDVIPRRHLSPRTAPELFVLTTPFPPDDRSTGYERGTSISSAWVQATRDASLETAAYIAAHLSELAGAGDSGSERAKKVREFCRRFVERAFRRPLSEELVKQYVDRPLAGGADLETAVKRVVLLALNSPRFLYPEVGQKLDGYTIASRLSLRLWDSLPDRALLEAAAAGKLATPTQVAGQAERMLADPRAHAKLRSFFLQWVKVDPPPDLSKNRAHFPGFDQLIAADLRTSLDLFLDDVLWSKASDFRQLLLADYLFLNGRLGRFYGLGLPADAPFQKVPLEAAQRAGILTHPYLMATFAYTESSSPIHRGVFLARSILGQGLRPPPEAVAPLPPDLRPELTTRERVLLQTQPQACQSCHGVINPLGFAMEHFDAVGRFRSKEKGRPIDSSGAYQTRSGQLVKFAGVPDLAKFLAQSDEVHEAIVEQLFHHLVRQPIRAYGMDRSAELKRCFVASACNLRKLVVEIMTATALKNNHPKEKKS